MSNSSEEVARFFAEIRRDPIARSLSHRQIRYLVTLGSFETTPRIGEAAAAAGVIKQNASSMVTSLEAHGLVERIYDPAELGAKRVRLTEDGRRLCDTLSRMYREP